MKKIMTVTILLMFIMCGCAQTYIGGTSFEKLKTASTKEYAIIGLGIGASFLTHEIAHIVLIEAFGADYDITFKDYQPHIEYTGDLSNDEIQWISRIGLLSQNVVGLFLPDDSYFTIGYNSMSAFQTITYPLRRDDGDLYELDQHGGNATLEWGMYSLISGYNLIRIEW